MANFSDDFTRRLLVDAGIGPGMRVLDIGCGAGDVTLLAAELVGEQGAVVGVDREAGPLVTGREHARERHLANVTFLQGDIEQLPSDVGIVDAVIGRRVLMYQPDGVRAIQRLADSVRSGGLIVFQEHDSTMVPACLLPMPLHQLVQKWIWLTVEREGANIHMGMELHSTLTRAGLSVEQVRAEAIVQTPTARYDIATIVRAMLPRIVRHGVATEHEIEIDTLGQRLDEERVRTNLTYVGDMKFGVWSRKPG
jgi:SAM-dependent methyltransferase